MKRSKTLVVCAMLGGSIMFSSCIGSFGLWNNLKDWNQGVSNKFVNELIFVAFHIVPVYEIAYLADALVLNSIEFWSGSNPTASIGEVKEVKGENGEYLVKTNTDGYTMGLVYYEHCGCNITVFTSDKMKAELAKMIPGYQVTDSNTGETGTIVSEKYIVCGNYCVRVEFPSGTDVYDCDFFVE